MSCFLWFTVYKTFRSSGGVVIRSNVLLSMYRHKETQFRETFRLRGIHPPRGHYSGLYPWILLGDSHPSENSCQLAPPTLQHFSRLWKCVNGVAPRALCPRGGCPSVVAHDCGPRQLAAFYCLQFRPLLDSGPAVWNSLPPALRKNMSLATFNTKLEMYPFRRSQ